MFLFHFLTGATKIVQFGTWELSGANIHKPYSTDYRLSWKTESLPGAKQNCHMPSQFASLSPIFRNAGLTTEFKEPWTERKWNFDKVDRLWCIRHCPHLRNPPLQPINPSQQSYCLWHKYNELVFQHCGGYIVNDFAVQAEMVAVETSTDMGNILWIFYDSIPHSTKDYCKISRKSVGLRTWQNYPNER